MKSQLTNNTSIHANGSGGVAAIFNIVRNCLVVTLQADITDEYLLRLERDTAEALQRGRFQAMILDVKSFEIIDLPEFERIRRIIDMAELMGTKTILASLRPGVAASLIEMGADTSGLSTSLSLDRALSQLENILSDNNDNEQK